ncbi:MAG: long-chain fatty acid--CoA ligase, partial [Rhodobacteraceae bacterium]|nr:long-chain fatty acid--CoA ligase [Paracoccaceae bacterium]
TGLLYARGPSTFSGYWRDPAETRKAVKDGWVTVGDVARRDKDGCYYIVDRAKDMVVSGGVNIYPREIEKVLMALPDVVECAVIGVPDSEWGVSPKRRRASLISFLGAPAFGERKPFCIRQLARAALERQRSPRTCRKVSPTAVRLQSRSIGSTR